MKLLTLALLLSASLMACAADTTTTASRKISNETDQGHHTVTSQSDKQWKVSGKDYAQLLEDCGQTTDYGLATDETGATGSEKTDSASLAGKP